MASYDVQKALRDGHSIEEINTFMQENNLQPLETDTPTEDNFYDEAEPVASEPEVPQRKYNVQKALKDGHTQEEINAFMQENNLVPLEEPTQPEAPQPESTTVEAPPRQYNVQKALKDGHTQEEIDAFMQENNLVPMSRPEDVGIIEGTIEALKQGIANLGDIKQGYELVLADGDEAKAEQMAIIKAQAASDEASKLPTLTASDIQRIAEESGYIPAGAQIPKFMAQQIALAGPQMVGPILAAMGTAAVTGPAAPVAAPLVGILTYGAQQFGNFMNTQGLIKHAPEELDIKGAAKWTAITAPIGFIADKFTVGIGKFGTNKIAKEVSAELAKRGAGKVVGGRAAKGATLGFIAEAPTEVIETWAELHQAGVDTSSDEAREAYFEAFWSAGAVGGGIKAPISAYQGYQDYKKSLESLKEVKSDDISSDEKIAETRGEKINAILTEQKGIVAAEEAKEISKMELGNVDNTLLNRLGIGKNTVAGKQLLDLDLTNPDNIEVAKNILNKENLKIKVNDTAVDSFRRKLNKQQKKLTQEAVDDKPKRRAPRTSTEVPKRPDVKPTPTVEESVGDGVVSPVADARQPDDTTGKLDTPLEFQGKKVPKTLINQYNTYKQADATADTPAKKTAVQNRQKKLLTAVNNFLGKDSNPETQAELVRTLEGLGVQEAQPQTAKQKAIQKAPRRRQTDEEALSDLEAEQIRQAETDLDVDEKPATRPGKIGQRQIIQALKPFKTLGQVFNSLGTKFRDAMTEPQKILLSKLSGLQNINKTKFQVVEKLEQRKDAQTNEPTGNYGLYTPTMDTAQVSTSGDVETVLHEATHAATANQINKHVRNNKGVTALGRRIVSLFDTAKQADTNGQFKNELNTVDEFITEAFNNPAFQKFLASIPSPESTPSRIATLWSDFVQAVSDLLGLGDISGTVLNDVIAVAPELFQGPNLQEQQRSRLGAMPQRRSKAKQKQIEDILDRTATPRQKEKEAEAKKPVIEPNKPYVSLFDKMATNVFSFDSALNNAIKRAMKQGKVKWDEIKQVLNQISASQALHAEEVAQQFLQFGEITYNKLAGKFQVVADTTAPSFKKIMDTLRGVADANGINFETMRKAATRAFVARRAQALMDDNVRLEQKAKNLVSQGKTDQARRLLEENYVLIDMTQDQINEALKLFQEFPELNDIHDMWIQTKNNAIKFMVDNEIMSEQQAEEFMNVVDTEGQPDDTYVPFFREDGPAPAQYQRGLGDRGKFYKIKGSYEPVADVFENMDKWIRNSIKRSILNRAAINKIDATVEYMRDEVKEVPNAGGPNTVSISRVNPETGTQSIVNYQFSNPYYATAIGGIENIMIDGLGFLSNVANFLRSNVVLYPLFSLAQLPQDAVSAMFSSGVSNPLMVPLRVLKEFPLTLIDMSQTHKDLQKFGAVGGFGSYLQGDTAADADLKKPGFYNALRRGLGSVPGITQGNAIRVGGRNLSISGLLNRIAMASDNAIRQAVYEQTMKETGDARLAVERAFEVINFRRAGANKNVTALRQVVPFFGAALQALSVQGRAMATVIGKEGGVAPQEKAKAIKAFLTAWGSLAGITLIYNMLMQDDEEFKKLDPKIRDRRLLLGNGTYLTLRPDIFTYLGKIMPEHVIQNMLYESEDNQKTYDALSRNAAEIVALNIMPQAVRPIMELMYNYSTRTGRPITPQSLDRRDITQQVTASTSETAKLLAQATGLSPTKIDYFLRQYFGYTAGLAVMFVDSMIDDANIFKYDRPSKSDRDLLASIPGMSAFIAREYGNRHTSDYFELKQQVDNAFAVYKDLDRYGFDLKRTTEFRDKNELLISAKKDINALQKRLTAIRTSRRELLQAPRDMISADEKKVQLDNLQRQEENLLGGILDIRKRIYGTKFEKP